MNNAGAAKSASRPTQRRQKPPSSTSARLRSSRPSAPRRGSGEQDMHVGQKVTLKFRGVNLEGAGVAAALRQLVVVPFALPDEEAVVEITAMGRRQAQGKIVTLLRKSPDAVEARCRHFGRCGGCQWQHLSYPAQLQQKTRLVRDHLAANADVLPDLVRETVGAQPWTYRNRIQATFAERRDRVVGGYYALGDRTIINVQECPIQQSANVALLQRARDVIAGTGWPIYDPARGRGLIRGVIGQVGMASGEVMLVLCTTAELPDRMAFVRAVRDRLEGVVSILLSVQPRHTPELLGRLHLLWGRMFVDDIVVGVRLRLYATPAIPPNPQALPLWVEAIRHAAGLNAGPTVIDVACEEGFVPLALAQGAARIIGIAPDREAMRRAWENARLNGIDTCLFYTRDPAGVLTKLRAKGEQADVVLVTARGRPTPPAVFAAAHALGARRLVCAAYSLTLLEADLKSALSMGYRVTEVQPVDLLPQTSRVHCVAQLGCEA